MHLSSGSIFSQKKLLLRLLFDQEIGSFPWNFYSIAQVKKKNKHD